MRETAEDRRESEAVSNARQRISLLAETFGTHHPEYATGLNQLALLLIMQADPTGAEPLLRQALQIRRETLGERHPDFATNLSSLGGLLWARGDLDQAEPLLRQAVEVRCETLGSQHPKSVVSVNSLEQLLKAKRDRAGSPTPAVLASGPERIPDPTTPIAPTAPPAVIKSVVPIENAVQAVTVEPMADSGANWPVSDQLAARLAFLQREFASLSVRISEAAEGLRHGTFPDTDELTSSLLSGRDAFHQLRRDTTDAARVHGVSESIPRLESLFDIGEFLPSLCAAESAWVAAESSRRGALSLLNRVDTLACPSDPTFAPLAACLEQARNLRQTIEAANPGEIPEAARLLNEGAHPLVALISLISSDSTTGDSQWADWYDAVVDTYGNALAVAAARCRLILQGS